MMNKQISSTLNERNSCKASFSFVKILKFYKSFIPKIRYSLKKIHERINRLKFRYSKPKKQL